MTAAPDDPKSDCVLQGSHVTTAPDDPKSDCVLQGSHVTAAPDDLNRMTLLVGGVPKHRNGSDMINKLSSFT